MVLAEEDFIGAVLMKDPSECLVLESKRWLECHGGEMDRQETSVTG